MNNTLINEGASIDQADWDNLSPPKVFSKHNNLNAPMEIPKMDGNKKVLASDLLRSSLRHLDDRGATYDAPEGERSIQKVVEAFTVITGDGLINTEERGWLYMVILKAVRTQQGDFKLDNYEDGAAYFALMGEAANSERGEL